tara:strand:+ start:180 stop:779 length:600 start_codon:yes stop_codon:yes gene_type:complete
MSDIQFVEDVPHRSPEVPLDNMKEFFENKIVMDLGCGGGDLMLYIKYKLNCKDIFGIEQTDRCLTNSFRYRLKIIKSDILRQKFESYGAETYYIWMETPELEIPIIKRLLKHNKKCDIIIAYNTKSGCKYDPLIPNNKFNFNSNCPICSYLNCISEKLEFITTFLETNNIEYKTKSYNYNNGKGCREFGEFTYLFISID